MNHHKSLFCLVTSLIFVLLSGWKLSAQVQQTQLKQFELQSSTQVKQEGSQISRIEYRSSMPWFKATVPSTVLTALVANKVYPDPYTGLNNMLIPDANDSFNVAYGLEKFSYLPNVTNPWKDPYWYRTTFKVDKASKGQNFQLIFDGINYRAEVWINGHLVADSSEMVGMFAKYNFDVTKYVAVGEENCVAVKIFPLDYPGTPDKEQLKALESFYLNGGPTGDIGKNVTMLCSVGWDWMPPVRDRNMGIWQPVYLRQTGSVSFGDTKLVTELPELPDTSLAKLKLDLTLHNRLASVVNGTVEVQIRPENFIAAAAGTDKIHFAETLTLPASGQKTIKLDASKVKELAMHNPKLWWPNGYGDPNLYRIVLKFKEGDRVLDDTSFVFGIRTVHSEATAVGGHYDGFYRRYFYVNGQRIHLVGGAWVPDMMLNRDDKRFDNEMLLCQNANLNLVRIWGGGVTPPEPFWDAADRHGLLVWSDFWVTGDTQGEFKGSPDYPYQGSVFINNVRSSILRIRNHPSLLVWTGGNEGHARKPLYDAMRQSVIDLDGTRPFIPSSSGFAKMPKGWLGSWPDNKPAGVYSGGPYSWKDPKYYYSLADTAKGWLFKDETGIPSQPPLNTLKKVIPDMVWDTTLPFPFNNTWGYHDACTGAGMYDKYYEDMVDRYGQPMNIDSFSNKMQLMNATGYQGIFEAANARISDNGGVMLWKLNAALPSVIWQIYDWYLLPNAGYYYMKKACEPVHIQFNQDDSTVAVINRSRYAQNGLKATATLFDINGRQLDQATAAVKSVNGDHAATALSLKSALQKQKGFVFIALHLEGKAGETLSDNIYWTAPGNDYKSLNKMSGSSLQVIDMQKKATGGRVELSFKLSNTGDQIAFFTRLQVMENAEELLPTIWSDNYVSVLPGKTQTVSLSYDAPAADTADLELLVTGWNTPRQVIQLKDIK